MKASFPPIETKDSKVLILGTMPGERSLTLQQYYGHKSNQFWKIMFELFEEQFSDNYRDRVSLIKRNEIALWDVLSHCEGRGSSDSKIKNEVPNDFVSFYENHPKITHVFFTSKKAEKFYNKYVGKSPKRQYYTLPSPSRANTWKTYEAKLGEWRQITLLIRRT